MIVDGHWVLFGSANWDARSLRLNFELNVECYGRDVARAMETVVQQKLRVAREVTLAKNNIAQRRIGTLSLMPAGFESALKPQDMADLLHWLRAP